MQLSLYQKDGELIQETDLPDLHASYPKVQLL